MEASSIAKFPESYSQTMAEKTLNSSCRFCNFVKHLVFLEAFFGANGGDLKRKGRKKEEQISESGSQFDCKIPRIL